MRLRNVQPGDVDLYVRMRCDPAMMAELGGPVPRDGIEAKVQRDVEAAESGRSWILMIMPEEAGSTVAGSVVIWTSDEHAEPLSEMGWMVLPEFQGRGLGKAAVRALLQRARAEDRWDMVHAFPSISNAPSNGICRAVGFTFVEEQRVTFDGKIFTTNHWQIDPRTDLAAPTHSVASMRARSRTANW